MCEEIWNGFYPFFHLSVLCLYLPTHIICHKLCSMSSTCILNKITLQKENPHFMTNYSFCTKKVKPQHQHNKANIKIIVKTGNRTRDLMHQSDVLTTSWPLKQLNESIVGKLFNCFNVIHCNTNEKKTDLRPYFFNKAILLLYCYIYMGNYI